MKRVLLSLATLATIALAACSNDSDGDNRVVAQTPLECQTARYYNGAYYNSNNQIIDCSNYSYIGNNHGFQPFNGGCQHGFNAINMGGAWQCAPASFFQSNYGFTANAGARFNFYASVPHYYHAYTPYAAWPTYTYNGKNCTDDVLVGAIAGGAAGAAIGNNIGSSRTNGTTGGVLGLVAGSLLAHANCN